MESNEMGRHPPLRDTFGMATATLRSNGVRSFLTMLGIVIGNASVITLVGVGRGAQNLAAAQLTVLGSNVVFVFPGSHNARHRGVTMPRTLVLADAEAIAQQVPSVRAVAPQISLSEVIQAGSRTKTTAVHGVTPSFLAVRQMELARGRFFSSQDLKGAHNVTVIGPDLADQLFPRGQAIGRRVRIRDQSFEVLGVMAPKGAFLGQNLDEAAYIPLSTMARKLSGRDPSTGIPLTFINVDVRDAGSTEAALFQITNLLRQRHHIRRDDDFEVRSQQEVMVIVDAVTGGLTLMLAAVGSISLLVGGIGIMNIMLVAVSERTAEIGLRKAVGARNRDVLLQFLLEALVLSTLGGVIGVACGMGAVAAVAAYTPLPAALDLPTLLLSLGVSSSIGLVFGVLPARRAARMDPITALQAH